MGFGKDGKGAILREQVSLSLSTLAAQAAVLANGLQLDENFRILKSEITCVVTGLTTTEGNGLILYLTNGDLSVTEVEECIEANGPLRPSDAVASERAERWVRRIGATRGTEVATEHVMANATGGPLLDIKPRWTFSRARTATEGGWNWVVYNDGIILTTGAVAHILATHYGVWVT